MPRIRVEYKEGYEEWPCTATAGTSIKLRTEQVTNQAGGKIRKMEEARKAAIIRETSRNEQRRKPVEKC